MKSGDLKDEQLRATWQTKEQERLEISFGESS
jgi:hypothetical protein